MVSLEDLLNDNVRGATFIFKDALRLFLSENDPGTIKYGVEKLRDQFPVMGLFVNLWKNIKDKNDIETICTTLRNLDRLMGKSFSEVIRKAGNYLPANSTIMTISHSSYVRELIINYKEKVKIVYCLESAPKFEGKVLAKFLLDNGIKSQTISDTSYPDYVSSSGRQSPFTKKTHVIIGSDLISEHFFINKSGTKNLIETTIEQGKNIWILGDELRFVSDYIPENIPEPFEIISMRDEFRVFK